jgi:hypothetical protein
VSIVLLWRSAAATDDRYQWNKRWGPLVPHTKFPKDCSLCHVSKNWTELRTDFKFDHKKETGYALEGAHAQAACLRCHNDRGPVQQYVARGCGGCHSDPHRGLMGLNCTRCHDQMTWQPVGQILEHAKTGFPLTGAHASLQCEQCHPRAAAQDYRGASPVCFSCHASDDRRAPNHVTMNFPRTCGNCHNTVSFAGALFNHSFLGNISNCYGCHSADYQRAANHVAMNFPQTCGNCHNTATWAGANFNHGFLGPKPNCYTCHAANYQSAPNHVAQGYPLTCGDCHNTTTWAGAVFNHPFPQTHGGATGCAICHIGSPASSANFSCTTNCHTNSANLASQHSGVSGYTYTQQSCYTCHPNGRSGG